jgi:hypothetical protein
MILSKSVQPILRRKQQALDVQDQEGLLRLRVKIGEWTLLSRFYTRIDQVFLLWGSITAVIFCTGQFSVLSWMTQAVLWTILTLFGALGTVCLAWYWVSVERLRWVIFAWVGLMLTGVGLTDWGIFGSGGEILPYLSVLWLGLSAVGYLTMGWGMKSRAFLTNGCLHLGAIFLLPMADTWQFLLTGIVTAGSLFLLAEVQWDMKSTTYCKRLTETQRLCNEKQQELRELEAETQCVSEKAHLSTSYSKIRTK